MIDDLDYAVATAIALEHIEFEEHRGTSRREMCELIGWRWHARMTRLDLVVAFASAWLALDRNGSAP